MTAEEVMHKFEAQLLDRWRRLGSEAIVTEERPHIVPLDSEAEGFVRWQQSLPCGHEDVIFGKFYTGFGTALIGDRWTQTFRFVRLVGFDWVDKIARVYETYLASLNAEDTEKVEIADLIRPVFKPLNSRLVGLDGFGPLLTEHKNLGTG